MLNLLNMLEMLYIRNLLNILFIPILVIAPEGGTISKTLGGIETSAGRGQPIQDPGKEQRIQEPREKRTGMHKKGANYPRA